MKIIAPLSLMFYFLFASNLLYASVPVYPHKEWSYTYDHRQIWGLEVDNVGNTYIEIGTRDDLSGNLVISVDAQGNERWHHSIPVDDHQLMLNKTQNRLYIFGIDNKNLIEFDLSGVQIRSTHFSNKLVRQRLYLLHDKYFYSPNFENVLIYDLSGKYINTLNINGEYYPYAINENLDVYTLDSKNGVSQLIAHNKNNKLIWKVALGKGSIENPVIRNQRIYVRFKASADAEKDKLFCLDYSGTILWSVFIDKDTYEDTNLAVDKDNHVYLLAQNKKNISTLNSYDSEGKSRWTTDLYYQHDALSSPSIGDSGNIYIYHHAEGKSNSIFSWSEGFKTDGSLAYLPFIRDSSYTCHEQDKHHLICFDEYVSSITSFKF